MNQLLSLIGGRATQFLFAGVFIGLLLPDLAAVARPLLAPSVGLMLGLTLLRVDWRSLGRWRDRAVFTSVAVSWILLLSPLLRAGLGIRSCPPGLSGDQYRGVRLSQGQGCSHRGPGDNGGDST